MNFSSYCNLNTIAGKGRGGNRDALKGDGCNRCITHTGEMTEIYNIPYQSTTIRNVLSVTLLH